MNVNKFSFFFLSPLCNIAKASKEIESNGGKLVHAFVNSTLDLFN